MIKNTVFEALFTDVSGEGFGVCHAPDGRACFVASALTGERATVKIIKEYKSYLIGRIEALHEPSEHRTEADCASYKRCGGCAFRHTSYENELEIKRKHAENTLRKIGGLEVALGTPKSGKSDGYRNKLLLPFGEHDGGLFCGFFARHSHTVVECNDCKLHTADFAEITKKTVELLAGNSVYDETRHKGTLRHLFLRRNKKGEFAVAVVINGKALRNADTIADKLMLSCPAVKSFFVNINTKKGNTVLGNEWQKIKGEDFLEEGLCGKRFLLSPASFFQVNPEMTEVLYRTAAEMADIKDGETVFDLYCGVGSVGLCTCPDSVPLCGVEIVPQAVENAKRNAALNGRENTHFICGDATEGFAECEKAFGKKPDCVLVDPPRAGLTPELIKQIATANPERVVYISCNVATLARDVKCFAEQGYNVQRAQTVDMFPRTAHLETVALLSRQKVTEHIYIDVNIADLPKTTRTTATYPEIKAYIKDKYGLCVSSLNIAQIKEKHGFEKRENYNKGKDGHRVPKCLPEKEKAIEDAFKYFGML